MKYRDIVGVFFLLVVGFFVLHFSHADTNVYYFDNAVNQSPGELGNYWLDEAATDPASMLPDFSADEVTVLSGATFDGDAIFNGSATNEGTVTGDATFVNDDSENNGTVDGTKTRKYTTASAPTRDFTIDGPWTIIADGVEVNLLSVANLDFTVTYLMQNGGYFKYVTITDAIVTTSSIILYYDAALDETSVPVPGDFDFEVNGQPVTINGVDVDGSEVTLSTSSTFSIEDIFRLTYTPGIDPLRNDELHLPVPFFENRLIPYGRVLGNSPLYGYMLRDKVYISNSNSGTVSVLDTATNDIISTLTVEDTPWYFSAIDNKLYVTNTVGDSVSIIDAISDTILDTIPTENNPVFSIIAGRTYYASNYASGTTLSPIDTTTDAPLPTVTVGGFPYLGALVGEKLYVANFTSGDVSVVDTTTNTTIGTIDVGDAPFDVEAVGSKVYVSNSDSNSVSVIDTTSDTLADTISVGQSPYRLRGYGDKLYVTNRLDGTISVIDINTDIVTDTITVGSGPVYIHVFDKKLYIANGSNATVSVIDGASDTVVDTLPAGPTISHLIMAGSKLYIPNSGSKTVSMYDVHSIPSQLPNLTNFSTSSPSGEYESGEVVPITAHFGLNIKNGSTMIVHFNSGGTAVLNNVLGNTISGTYIIGGSDATPDLAIDSITSASVTDSTNTYNRTSYDLPNSQGNFEAENSFIMRNLGDSKNIAIGSYKTITTGSNPYQVSSAINGYVYVANQGSDDVSVVQVSDNTVVDTIAVGSEPYGLSYANGNMYVANTGSDSVSVINTTTNAVIATVAVGVKPYYVATIGTKVYVTNGASNSVSVIDTNSNTVVDTITVGSYPRGIKAHGTDLYVANYGDENYSGGNYISVIDSLTNEVTDTVILPAGSSGPRGVVVNGSKAYVTNFRSNNVSVIDTGTNAVIATIPVGMGPRGTATLGTKVYIENFDDGTVSVIDTTTDTVTATVDVGHSPAGMGVSGTDIYLSRFQDNELSILDTVTNTLQALPVVVPPSSGGGNGGGGGVVIIPQTTPVIPVTVPTTPPPQMPEIHTFTDHLRLYSRGSDVIYLQKYLNTHGFLIAKSGPGSPGKETDYFGALTKAALVRFQKVNKLVPDGVFGPLTRGRVNSTP